MPQDSGKCVPSCRRLLWVICRCRRIAVECLLLLSILMTVNDLECFASNESLLTYLLTPWCRVLPEQLTGLQLVKKFPAFHGTRRFITALTSVRHRSLSWASPIQSTCPHHTSWRVITEQIYWKCCRARSIPCRNVKGGFRQRTFHEDNPITGPEGSRRATLPYFKTVDK